MSSVADLYELRRLLERSISLDPNYARAYAMLSVAHFMAWVEPLDEDHLSPAVLERAHRFARKAVQLDPNLPIAHAQLGKVLTFEGQHDQSIAAFEKAFALNRNFTDWWFGAALNCAGEPARATEVIEAQMRYDPFHAPAASGALGFARYMLKEYSQALPPLRECASRAPNLSVCHLWLAATLAQLGQLDEARAEAAEVLRINAKFTIDGTQRRLSLFKRPEDVRAFLRRPAQGGPAGEITSPSWPIVHLRREADDVSFSGNAYGREWLPWVCAVQRRRSPVGANPTRQPLQPEATGAAMEVTKWLKPSVSVSRYTVTARVCRP